MLLIPTDHCKFCYNQIIDFSKGTLCNLTNEKPDFEKTCMKIKLEEKFEKEIKSINIELEAVIKTKIDVYGMFIFNLLIAAAFVFSGVFLAKFILISNVISTIPIMVMGIAIIPLGKAFGPLNYYFLNLKIAKQKKERLDQVCLLYGYNYEIDIVHLKDSLGNKSYNTDLKIRRTSTKK